MFLGTGVPNHPARPALGRSTEPVDFAEPREQLVPTAIGLVHHPPLMIQAEVARQSADVSAVARQREGQGIPTAPSDGRYGFERQVAADRYYAAHLLGDLKDPRGIALLVPLLDGPETRSIVPWSLGQIGDKRESRL